MSSFELPDEDENLVEFMRVGAEAGGAAVGAGVGLVLAGPPGALLGAAVGPVASKAFQAVAAEVSRRFLSPRERRRASTLFMLAVQQINDRRKAGERIRSDGFFDPPAETSPASEILEALLLAARSEYEERKLPYLATLLSSLAFTGEIDLPHAVALVRVAESLSYRQLCLIALYKRVADEDAVRGGPLRGLEPVSEDDPVFALVAELSDLESRRVITGASTLGGPTKFFTVPLARYTTKLAHQLYDLMGLSRVPESDIGSILRVVTVREVRDVQ